MILAPPLAYFALQIVEGAFVTPMVLGRRLELSTVAILVTLALTTWMWGIIGAVIGVPLLVVVKAFCDQFPSLATFGVFLSADVGSNDDAEPAVTPPAQQEATRVSTLPPLPALPPRSSPVSSSST